MRRTDTLPRWLLLALLPLLTHCASAPRLEGIEPSSALPPVDGGRVERVVDRQFGAIADTTQARPSSVRMVEQNALAFAYRASTAAVAERSLDVQYYIWHDDRTGKLLAAELMMAAERGVRVRVLVDDVDARAKHELFVVADLHPNLEVRVFNPFHSRAGMILYGVEWLMRYARLNKRMHNKIWLADGHIAIVGGRNIGDEYFGASEQMNFNDLDVLLAGPIVADVSRAFDAYWNDPSAIPVSRLDSKPPSQGDLDALLNRSRAYLAGVIDADPFVASLLDPVQREAVLAAAPPPVSVGAIQLLVDDPGKIGEKNKGVAGSNVLTGLSAVIADATQEVLLFSPYFVPGRDGADSLIRIDRAGRRVAVLTNSLAATDVAAVHTGYARYRKDLLRGGVELYEMKRKTASEKGRRQISVTGSTTASLHTKAALVDDRWVFVGSMNIDPRSAFLNTEMGVLFESSALADQLRTQFQDNTAPLLSYRVEYEKGEGLVWFDRTAAGEDRRHDDEPDASIARRISVTLLRLLPIEAQL
jgi:putative cardiolipin synthase